ncbi:MAG: hypothetical protein ABSE59_05015 [Opitutaceae bacterium]
MPLKHLLALVVLAAAGLTRLAAQGSPPMITDDPGTPGNNKWEINLGWTTQLMPGTTEIDLPLLDANYGIGDRFQVTCEIPWAVAKDNDGSQAGLGDSTVGAKWRFYDAGEHSWQASVFPQLTFLVPGSHSDRRGLADSGTALLLPIEAEKDLGPITVDFDGGHIFSSQAGEDRWMGGLAFGREVISGWELGIETHLNASNRLDRTEWIVNAGTKIDLSDHLSLMFALGRDLSSNLGPRASLLSYVGVQIRL